MHFNKLSLSCSFIMDMQIQTLIRDKEIEYLSIATKVHEKREEKREKKEKEKRRK